MTPISEACGELMASLLIGSIEELTPAQIKALEVIADRDIYAEVAADLGDVLATR